jgi:YbbR domain-containing protein
VPAKRRQLLCCFFTVYCVLTNYTNKPTHPLFATSNTYKHVIHTVQAKQLKDYENAVIAKRMEELDEDELQALVEEVERDDF